MDERRTSKLCLHGALSVIVILATTACLPVQSSDVGKGKLLVILLDGFRWNYFDKAKPGELPGFDKLRRQGSMAHRLIPQFPSLSFVNYYSIMTG